MVKQTVRGVLKTATALLMFNKDFTGFLWCWEGQTNQRCRSVVISFHFKIIFSVLTGSYAQREISDFQKEKDKSVEVDWIFRLLFLLLGFLVVFVSRRNDLVQSWLNRVRQGFEGSRWNSWESSADSRCGAASARIHSKLSCSSLHRVGSGFWWAVKFTALLWICSVCVTGSEWVHI